MKLRVIWAVVVGCAGLAMPTVAFADAGATPKSDGTPSAPATRTAGAATSIPLKEVNAKTFVVEDAAAGMSSKLTIVLDQPTADAPAVMQAITRAFEPARVANQPARVGSTSPTRTGVQGILPPDGGGSYANLYCNHYYPLTDGNGTFNYQHACGGSTAPWGYTLSPALRSIITSSVHELGMSWWLFPTGNMPQGAPHYEPSGYVFHGTFNPIRAGAYFSYSDTFTFRVQVGAMPGTGTIRTDGDIHQVN